MWFEERNVEVKTLVCKKGHIGAFYVPVGKRHEGEKCLVCGSGTMTDCPGCGEPIGRRISGGSVPIVCKKDLEPQPWCRRCGAVFPWGRSEGAGVIRAVARRILVSRVGQGARIATSFTAGLAGAVCILAGRQSWPASSGVAVAQDGQYRVRVGVDTDPWGFMDLTDLGWMCDCHDFRRDAARCRHVWAVALTEGLGRLGGPCAGRGFARYAPKKSKLRTDVEMSMRTVSQDRRRFEEVARDRMESAWAAYLEWDRRSNRDLDAAADMAGRDPEAAMYHTQQAAEKQVKAVMLYCSAFDDKFDPKRLTHTIFKKRSGRELEKLLCKHRLELKEMTLGVSAEPSKSGFLRELGTTPALLADGIDLDEHTALSVRPEEITLEWYYRYLRESLSPPLRRPREVRCPMRAYVPDHPWERFDYGKGLGAFALAWEADAQKITGDLAGSWAWRYYALYLHEGARYPSATTPLYAQNEDVVRGWVFEAGFMISRLQERTRWYHAGHVHKDGYSGGRELGAVRDLSWYERQMGRPTGD